RHSHQTKIVGSNEVYFGCRSLAGRIRRRAGEMKGTGPFGVVKGNVQTERGSFNAGKRANSFDELIIKVRDLFVRIIARLWQQNVGHQNVCRIESERCILCVAKTFQGQSRAGEQEQGESDLRDDQSRSHTLTLRAIAGSAASFVQRKRERSGARDSQRRPDTNQETGADRYCGGKGEHFEIEIHFLEASGIRRSKTGGTARRDCLDRIKSPKREKNASDSAEDRQDCAFDEHLLGKLAATCAKSGAHS